MGKSLLYWGSSKINLLVIVGIAQQSNLVEHQGPSPADFFSLLKPRVMTLVIFTGICGMVLAPGSVHPLTAFTAILCLAIGAGGAGCLNMYYERDRDAKMERTKDRVIVTGVVPEQSALAFGAILTVFSTSTMFLLVNAKAALVLLISILLYVFFYTLYLKPRTPQNIVWGGLPGAIPPVIGWYAVSNSWDGAPWLLCLVIFLWTPPHFWALAIKCMDDYERGGYPMFPNVYGVGRTKKEIFVYTWMLVGSSFLPYYAGMVGILSFIAAVSLGILFIGQSISFLRSRGDDGAMKTFGYSIFYLFLLFLVYVVDYLFIYHAGS